MTAEPKDLKVENALLRGTLWLITRALRDYHEAPHFEIDDDGKPMLKVIVQLSLREKTGEVLARAQKILAEPDLGRAP